MRPEVVHLQIESTTDHLILEDYRHCFAPVYRINSSSKIDLLSLFCIFHYGF